MVPPDRLESRIEARGTMRDGSPTPSADIKNRIEARGTMRDGSPTPSADIKKGRESVCNKHSLKQRNYEKY